MEKPSQFISHYNLFFSPTESQLVNITSHPASPLRVLEGQPLTLEWTFSVASTLLRVELRYSYSYSYSYIISPVAPVALVEASSGGTIIRGVFLGRVSASSTQTNATITFSSLNRTDTANYVFAVVDTARRFAEAPLQIIVHCKFLYILVSDVL